MRIYLAAPWECGDVMRSLRKTLAEADFRVFSRWLDEKETDNLNGTGMHAAHDLEDIDGSDVVVVYQPKEFAYSGTGGRHVEFGYALAKGKILVLYGTPSNVFHRLATVHQVIDRPSFLVEALHGIKNRYADRLAQTATEGGYSPTTPRSRTVDIPIR